MTSELAFDARKKCSEPTLLVTTAPDDRTDAKGADNVAVSGAGAKIKRIIRGCYVLLDRGIPPA